MEVLVNAAMSADGKLSTVRREQISISGSDDFDRVDRLRRSVDAILVGIGTVLADDPSLTVDTPDGDSPVRVILDSQARTPIDARVLDGQAETTIVVTERASTDRIDALAERGATVLTHGADQVALSPTLRDLEHRGVDRLLVEGGGEVLFSMFEAELVDRLTLFVGPMVIGGRDAPTLVDGEGFPAPDRFPRLGLEGVERMDDGVLLTWSVS